MTIDSRRSWLASARVRTGIALGGAFLVVGAAYVAWPDHRSFDRLPTSSIKASPVAFSDDPATLAFMQNAALSHVAPLRPEQPDVIETPPKKDRISPEERDRRRERAAQRMSGKPVEVAVLPPPRPRGEPVQVAAPAAPPPPEPTRILGIAVKMPSIPEFPDVLPSGKQVRERASEWADRIAAAVKLR